MIEDPVLSTTVLAHILLFNTIANTKVCSFFDATGASKKTINIYRKEREMIRKIAAAAMLLMCMWALSGCHTIHGAGEDLESGGRAIERSSGK